MRAIPRQKAALTAPEGDLPLPAPAAQPEPVEGKPPLAYRAVRGGLWVALSSYWTIAVGFVANIVLTRIIDPTAFGQFALAMFFAQLFRLQPKVGLGYAFAQQQEDDASVTITYIVSDAVVALAGVLLTGIAIPFLLLFGYARIVVLVGFVLACSAAIEGLTGIGGTLLDRQLRFRPMSITRSIVFPLSYVPALWLGSRGAGIWGLVAQNLTYNAAMLVSILWIQRKQLPYLRQLRRQFSPAVARRLGRFGLTVGAGLLGGLLLTQFDNFLIGTFVSATVLGFYDRAYRIAQWPSMLMNSLTTRTAFYTYAQLQSDPARLRKSVEMMSWLIMMLALPLALVIFFAAPDLVSFLYGEKWAASVIFLRFLVAYSVARPMLENTSSVLIAIGHPKQSSILVALQVGVLIVAAVPLTFLAGAVGTSVGVGIAFLAGMLANYVYLHRYLGIRLWDQLIQPLVVAGLSGLLYFGGTRLINLESLPIIARLISKGALVLAAFVISQGVLGPRMLVERYRYLFKLARGMLGHPAE